MTTFGWRLAIACVFLFGCATAHTGPPTVDVTGTWTGQYGGVSGGSPVTVTMTLRQVGADVNGSIEFPAVSRFNGPITGGVSGNNFSWRSATGGGHATVQGNSMDGVSNTGARVTLQRQ